MTQPSSVSVPASRRAVVVGGGPAGLMAAETLSQQGIQVDLYDAMPSVGRKFLLAGKGGMNLTHSEPMDRFMARYGKAADNLQAALAAFDNQALRDWAQGLGVATFIGSSGRVFPTDMKAAPLLRAWLHRLREQGVRFHMRHRWLGWDAQGHCRFVHADAEIQVKADVLILALGGGSWARLGSDGSWMPLLAQQGVALSPLLPSNCGFERPWTPFFQEKFAGQPLLTVAARVQRSEPEGEQNSEQPMRQGQFVITASGVEGSLIYALSAALRDQILAQGSAVLELDLLPDKSVERVLHELQSGRGARSLSSFLQTRLGLDKLKIALLYELLSKAQLADTKALALAIKQLPLPLLATRPLDEAISSAGGVRFSAIDERGMLTARAGVFCAGEMLDWEAPTGGYLLTACFATGKQAALAALDSLNAAN